MRSKYDDLSREELAKLLQARDKRDATRFGLVWEANEIESDRMRTYSEQLIRSFSEFVLASMSCSGIFTLFFRKKHQSPLTSRVGNPPYT
jgi:hypothetical protein